MTRPEALALFRSGRKRTVAVLLAQELVIRRQARRIKALEAENNKLKGQLTLAKDHPDTPSGMKPAYAKPVPAKRGRRPGAKEGHQGHSRHIPDKAGEIVEHRLGNCPDCRGELSELKQTRSRFIEDIPPIEPKVTEHILHRYWCCKCGKTVEPTVSQAFPGCILGNNMVIFSGWLHYGLGVTVDKVVELLNVFCRFKVTAGGLIQAWQRLADYLKVDYQQLRTLIRSSSVLHADETSWRLNGKTQWLWCYTNPRLAYYSIERNRGSPAVKKVLGKRYDGTLVTDFYAAYNAVKAAARQRCLTHLDRDIRKADLLNRSSDWKMFRDKLKRWISDARSLGRLKSTLSADVFGRRRNLLEDRLILLGYNDHLKNKDARRLAGRLCTFRHQLLTFLDQPGVSPSNNHAERQIRPAVIIRKNSYCNRSRKGTEVQSTMMSIFQTLHLNAIDPLQTLRDGFAAQLSLGQPALAATLNESLIR
jgi:transposase